MPEIVATCIPKFSPYQAIGNSNITILKVDILWREQRLGSTIELYLPGVGSLKEKRGILKSMLAKLHNAFNVSVAEINYHDRWQSAMIAIAVASNSATHARQIIGRAVMWIESHYPNALITKQEIEVL